MESSLLTDKYPVNQDETFPDDFPGGPQGTIPTDLRQNLQHNDTPVMSLEFRAILNTLVGV